MNLAYDLLERIVLHADSPSRLRAARNCFVEWASEEPDSTDLQNMIAEIDARLMVLGNREPPPVSISNRARDVADELDLPGNPMMLEFLSHAEILLEADGNDPDDTYDLMVQAGGEYVSLIVQASARRQIQ